ncbi:MAG: toll/interleukin-1 receptor domain-containing protein [Granulosicoccus sp.]
MRKNRIFLSYRRDDSPGYVSRLEEELERVFGKGRVFRDATDIPGGAKWKNVIDENLHSSAVLILVIGPRWEKIWLERINDEINYVALELLRAQELDVPIIPVTLDGTRLSKELDLGSIKFIYENQFHDISDKQGRWSNDVARLVSLLEVVPGIGSPVTHETDTPQAKSSGRFSGFKWIVAFVSLIVIAAVAFGLYTNGDEAVSINPPAQPIDPTTAVPGKDLIANPGSETSDPQITISAPTHPESDISGTWQFEDGTIYIFQENNDGTYGVESAGNITGQARFMDKMPGKLEIELSGVGRGEFSGFNTGRALGWFVYNGSSQQDFGALVKLE